MKLGIRFDLSDAALQSLGEAVVAFVTAVSEADPMDVSCVLAALQAAPAPDRVDSDDVATILGTINALKLRLEHDASGGPVVDCLAGLDTSELRGH